MGRRSKSKERARFERAAADLKEASASAAPVTAPVADTLGLRVLVLTTGAILMALEIAGSRVLAPHFGNSVFVWGSLISIFLIALSLGYYVGGRVADRFPSRLLLHGICVAVSLWIAAIALLAHRGCEALAERGLSEQSGPLVASSVFFLPPSVGLGMVSPFAIRLATRSVTSVGKISGTLYALSTLGSIAGTMLTTFLLIPLLGTATILKGMGLALLLVSLLTLPVWPRGRELAGTAALAILTVACVFWPVPPRLALGAGETLVFDVDTPYHHISVIDNALEDSRQLRFDRFIESAIRKTTPFPSLSSYTNYFHLAFLVQPEIERTLFIGAGGGIGPREFHMQDPGMEIDVVDIDATVLAVAHDFFFLERDPQIRTFAEDGRMFVRRPGPKYDCVVLDAFTIGGRIPFHLVTREFLQLCRQRLNPGGVFIMNINSAHEGPLAQIFQAMYRTTASVFPNTYVFARQHLQDRGQSMNIILLAAEGGEPLTPDQWAALAARHRSRTYVDDSVIQFMVGDLLLDLPDVSRASPFTDDFAPIETMSF